MLAIHHIVLHIGQVKMGHLKVSLSFYSLDLLNQHHLYCTSFFPCLFYFNVIMYSRSNSLYTNCSMNFLIIYYLILDSLFPRSITLFPGVVLSKFCNMQQCFPILTVEEDEIHDAETGSASKRRRSTKTVRVQKSSFNRCACLYCPMSLIDIFVLCLFFHSIPI